MPYIEASLTHVAVLNRVRPIAYASAAEGATPAALAGKTVCIRLSLTLFIRIVVWLGTVTHRFVLIEHRNLIVHASAAEGATPAALAGNHYAIVFTHTHKRMVG